MLLYRWFIKALKGLVVWMPDFLMFSQALTKGKHLWSLQHLKIFDEIFLFHFYLLIFWDRKFYSLRKCRRTLAEQGFEKNCCCNSCCFFSVARKSKTFLQKAISEKWYLRYLKNKAHQTDDKSGCQNYWRQLDIFTEEKWKKHWETKAWNFSEIARVMSARI